jgi:hypothetical protein
MKNKPFKPGTFLRIPLADGTFAYGRQLEEIYMAFYNYRTREPSADLDAIEGQPVLFRHMVRNSTIKTWDPIGNRELRGEVAVPVFFFHQEIGDYRKCTISDNLGNERPATPEECIGLEREAVWDAHHIEERLLDTFEGRPNRGVEHLKVRLK